MTCYIVAFQSTDKEARSKIRELLKTYTKYCPINDTCWAVVTDQKAKDVRDHLKTGLDPEGRLFVVRSGTEAAWWRAISTKHSDWLKTNL